MPELPQQQKRMIIVMIIEAVALLIAIALLVLNEYHWRTLWSEYEFVDEYSTDISAEQDGNGINIISGGDIDYGTESTSNDTENKK